MRVAELRLATRLDEENRRLMQVVADHTLDNQILRGTPADPPLPRGVAHQIGRPSPGRRHLRGHREGFAHGHVRRPAARQFRINGIDAHRPLLSSASRSAPGSLPSVPVFR
jgi:hypothetical protein